ncbi:hypothetical protein U1707_17535 [Sphingomonas sp. PB2P12]|uniref:hypothetical protein n=1 Tax=Sphingomonas sandaracina TaxID=3096157 RepID=UPI002FCB6A8B
MATITEEALQGEWFYLEEEQPLDLSSPSFYMLADGIITPNDRPDDVGSYVIEGERRSSSFQSTLAPH